MFNVVMAWHLLVW